MEAFYLSLVTLGAALVVLHIAKILSSCVKVSRYVMQFLPPCRRGFSSCLGSPDEEVRLIQEVNGRVRAWQTEQVHTAIYVVAIVNFALVTSFLCDAFDDLGQAISAPGQVMCDVASYGSLLVLLFYPAVLTSKSLDIWFIVLLLPICLRKSPLVCLEASSCPPTPPYLRISIGMLVLSRMHGLSSLAACSLWAGASYGRYSMEPSEMSDEAWDAFVSDTMVIVAAAALSTVLHRRAREHVSTAVEAEFLQHILQQRQEASRCLLNTFYDVVLELDTDLKITRSGLELATFLLHTGRVSFDTMHFQDFVVEEDRQLVCERLRLPTQKQCSLAQVVHAHMMGANEITLKVELFMFGWEGLTGGTCYVVGIREHSDRMGVPRDQGAEGDDAEVSVEIDTSNENLPIVSTSAAFNVNVGQFPNGSSLLNQVSNEREFGTWLQEMINTRESGPDLNCTQSFRVDFRPTGAMKTHAWCTFVPCDRDDGPGEEDETGEDGQQGTSIDSSRDTFNTQGSKAKLVFSDMERQHPVSVSEVDSESSPALTCGRVHAGTAQRPSLQLAMARL